MRKAWVIKTGAAAALGLLTSIAVAWAAAALRPNDGRSNVLGTSPLEWEQRLRMPLHRVRSARGDVFVAYHGSAVTRTITLRPRWNMREVSERELELAPYPESVNPEYRKFYVDMSLRLPAWAPRVDALNAEWSLAATAWGWPAMCLAGGERVVTTGMPLTSPAGLATVPEGYLAFPGNPAQMRVRRLPLRPVWPGLLACSAFYAVGWSVVLLAPGAALQSLRLRRGLCPHCGYDLRALPEGEPCPECGSGGRPASRSPASSAS